MAGWRKKKYRGAADFCHAYPGLSADYVARNFDGGLSPEAEYGLSLNIRRINSIAGGQFYRSMFYLFTMGFGIDDDIASSLSDDDDYIEVIKSQYEVMYRESVRCQDAGRRH